MPPGTTKGRCTLGYLIRRARYAGKMNRYDRVVVEMTKPSTNPNNPAMLPVLKKVLIITAAIIATEAVIPDMVFTAIGVPYRPLKRPSRTGAVRSSDAMA